MTTQTKPSFELENEEHINKEVNLSFCNCFQIENITIMLNIKDKEIAEAKAKYDSFLKKIEKNKKKLEISKRAYEKSRRINLQLKKLICTGITQKEKGQK